MVTALGFDYGVKRIGIAVGQTLTKTATPLVTLPARAGQPDWQVLGRLLAEWRPDYLVVGMPSAADGQAHPLEAAIKRFGGRLLGRFGLPVLYVDERLSSHVASTMTNGSAIDAMAARLILETWLNTHHHAASSA
ncbi:MAG: Holliday junction resolvase RuvX [Gammaproteobacteria bacterium]|nr:Holliday junction resolvase RuvX [Gammaproteobacteria bacterium]